jgi:hypothetical protein
LEFCDLKRNRALLPHPLAHRNYAGVHVKSNQRCAQRTGRSFNPGLDLSVTMGLNWKSVKAVHVTQACEVLLNSARPGPKPRGLVVTYKDKKLTAKAVLRMAYRLANNTPPETKLKFSSGEGSLQLFRSLGFRAERLQTNNPVAKND